MNSMHKLDQATPNLGEQILAELRAATQQQHATTKVDLQRVLALAERLAVNSRAMHDTLGTLFDSLQKSEEHAVNSEEGSVMNEQTGALEKDIAGMKVDIASLKLDIAVVRSNYASKSDVAEAKSAVILSCVGTMIALSGVAFAVAKLVH